MAAHPELPVGGWAFLHWRNVNPFGVQSSSQFRADAPPALTGAEYANDLNEVLALGDINSPNRSQHDADVARIYAAQPPHQGWNSVARQIINTRDDEITDTARVLALMNMSLSDAHITVFESKYFYRTWRPETAIPRAAEDGNPATQPNAFTPFIATPCFPGYPSAHGAGAGRRAAFSGKPTVATTRSSTRIQACRASSSLTTICLTSRRTSPTPASTAESTSAPIRTRRSSKVNLWPSGCSITSLDPPNELAGRAQQGGWVSHFPASTSEAATAGN